MKSWSFLAIGLVLGIAATLVVDRVVLNPDTPGQTAFHTNEECAATSGEPETASQNSFQTDFLQQENSGALDGSALAPSPHDDVSMSAGKEELTGDRLPEKDLVNKVVPDKTESNEF